MEIWKYYFLSTTVISIKLQQSLKTNTVYYHILDIQWSFLNRKVYNRRFDNPTKIITMPGNSGRDQGPVS